MSVQLVVTELREVRRMLRVGAADETSGEGDLLGLLAVIVSGVCVSVVVSHGGQKSWIDNVNTIC